MKRLLLSAILFLASLSAALAQTSPNFAQGFVPTPAQWNGYFAAKQDLLGFTPLNVSGGFLTGKLSLFPSASLQAGLNIGVGVAPSVPMNGDMWALASGLCGYFSNVTTCYAAGVTVTNPGDGALEVIAPNQAVTGASRTFTGSDLFKRTARSNSGSAMTDTLPAAVSSYMLNGTRLQIVNTDVTASDTISAFSGTTIFGAATFVLLPGRDIMLSWDPANLNWRAEGNSNTAILGPTVTRTGDLLIWNAAAGTWQSCPGNNSGTQTLTETAAGACAWSSYTTGTVTSITPGAGLSSTPATGGSTAITSTGALYTDAAYYPGFLGGLVLSNDGTTPNSVLDIEAGAAVDSTNTVFIKLGTFTKSTAGAWATGSGSTGMGNGLTITASTWYHVCLGYQNGGVNDVWFDTSVSCTNRPAGFTTSYYRRIGAFKTNGASQIITFVQNGDEVLWVTPTEDVAAAALGTTATLFTLNVPPGVKVNALCNVSASNAASQVAILFNSPDVASLSGGSLVGGDVSVMTQVAGSLMSGGLVNLRTDTAQRIRGVSTLAASTVYVVTHGWVDTRGKTN